MEYTVTLVSSPISGAQLTQHCWRHPCKVSHRVHFNQLFLILYIWSFWINMLSEVQFWVGIIRFWHNILYSRFSSSAGGGEHHRQTAPWVSMAGRQGEAGAIASAMLSSCPWHILSPHPAPGEVLLTRKREKGVLVKEDTLELRPHFFSFNHSTIVTFPCTKYY